MFTAIVTIHQPSCEGNFSVVSVRQSVSSHVTVRDMFNLDLTAQRLKHGLSDNRQLAFD